jgi:hypothetical protein
VITRELRPNLVDVTLATAPAGLALTVNDEAFAAPRTLISWQGYTLDIGAADQTSATGQRFRFDRWSDGGAATHAIVTPAATATYTASFRIPPVFVPLVVR